MSGRCTHATAAGEAPEKRGRGQGSARRSTCRGGWCGVDNPRWSRGLSLLHIFGLLLSRTWTRFLSSAWLTGCRLSDEDITE